MTREGQRLPDRVYEFLQAMGYRTLGRAPSADLVNQIIADRIGTLNPLLNEGQRREALQRFQRRTGSLTEREWVHTALLYGVRVSPEEESAFTARLLALDVPEDNLFQVARDVSLGEFTVDLGLYINGVLVALIECIEDARPVGADALAGRLVHLSKSEGADLTSVQLLAGLSTTEAIYGGVGAPPQAYRTFSAPYPDPEEFRRYQQGAPTLHGELLYSLFAPANLLDFLHFLTVTDTHGTSTVAGPFQRVSVHQALAYFDEAQRGKSRPPGLLPKESEGKPPRAALLFQPVGTGRSATIAWIVHALQLQPSTQPLGLIVVADRRVLAEQVHQMLRSLLKTEVLLAFTSQEFQECVQRGHGAVIVTAAQSLRNWAAVPEPTERGWGVIIDQLSPPTPRLLDTLDLLFHQPIVLVLSSSPPTARGERSFHMLRPAFDLAVRRDETQTHVPVVVTIHRTLSAKSALAEAAFMDKLFGPHTYKLSPQQLGLNAQSRILRVTLDEGRLHAVASDIAEHWATLLKPRVGKALVIVHSWAVAHQLAQHLEGQLEPSTVAIAGNQFEEERARARRSPVGSFGAGIPRAYIRQFQQEGPPYLWISTHVPTGMDLACTAIYLDKKVNRTELLQLLALLTRRQTGKAAAYLVDYWGNLDDPSRLADELALPLLTQEEALTQLEDLAVRARQVMSLPPLIAQASANDPTQRNADTQLLHAFTAALELVGARFAPAAIRQLHSDFERHIEQLYSPLPVTESLEWTGPQALSLDPFEDSLELSPLDLPQALMDAELPEEDRLTQELHSYFGGQNERFDLPELLQGIRQLSVDAPYRWWEKPTARRLVRRQLRQLLQGTLLGSDEPERHLPNLLNILEEHARIPD